MENIEYDMIDVKHDGTGYVLVKYKNKLYHGEFHDKKDYGEACWRFWCDEDIMDYEFFYNGYIYDKQSLKRCFDENI